MSSTTKSLVSPDSNSGAYHLRIYLIDKVERSVLMDKIDADVVLGTFAHVVGIMTEAIIREGMSEQDAKDVVHKNIEEGRKAESNARKQPNAGAPMQSLQ